MGGNQMTLTQAQLFGLQARDIVQSLDLNPDLVRTITLSPRSVTVELYETNEHGRRFVGADGQVALRKIVRPLEWPKERYDA